MEKILHVLDTRHLDTLETVKVLHWSMAEMTKRYAVAGETPAVAPAEPRLVGAVEPALSPVRPGG
jgi:hypothetical protein